MRMVAMMLVAAMVLASCNGGGEQGGAQATKGVKVCGSSNIYGKKLTRVRSSKNRQCGFGDAVEVYHVAGVAVRGAPQIRCSTAKALEKWTSRSAVPAVRRATGETLTEMTIWVGYACRNRSSGRLSEHALGNAVDIAAFRTNKGSFTVKNDWRKGGYGRAMQTMKKGACGPFGVVLHPDNDRNHHDHFHFDTSHNSSRYRYCRQRP